MTSEFPAYGASNAKDASIWWRHHDNNYAHSLRFVMNGYHPILSTILCAYWMHRMLTSKPVKQPCQILVNASHCHLRNYDITTTKLNKTIHTLCNVLINSQIATKPRFDVPSPVTWHEQQASIRSLCEGNSPVTGEFPAYRASSAGDVSIWWRHHDNNYAHSLRFVMNGYHPILSTVLCAYWSQRMLTSKPVKQPCQIWVNA